MDRVSYKSVSRICVTHMYHAYVDMYSTNIDQTIDRVSYKSVSRIDRYIYV